MKRIINDLLTGCIAVAGLSFVFSSCEEEGPMKSVDLRYRVEDMYEVTASTPKSVKFLVKSSDPWEILASEEWYSVSPKSGEAGQTDTVTISFHENVNLDDRQDTLKIKSDYWIGKEFVVKQKGTAYLNVEDVDFILGKGGDKKSFTIKSNQKWSAEVTEGENWLKILAGSTGERDGNVEVESSANKGEARVGKVTIFDRHTNPVMYVECNQDGITLTPAIPENGKWHALQHEAQIYEIPVVSDVNWTAVIEDETVIWAKVDKSTNKDKLVVELMENTGQAVREVNILLSTEKVEGAEPVKKIVRIKQINKPYFINVAVNKDITSAEAYRVETGMEAGMYIFHIKPGMTAANGLFSFEWHWGTAGSDLYRFQYHLVNGSLRAQSSPWNTIINKGNEGHAGKYYRTPDWTKAATFGYKYEKYVKEDGTVSTNCFLYVNGEEVMNMFADGGEYKPNDLLWDNLTKNTGRLDIICKGPGVIPVESYDFYPAPDWGE